jgi:CheY-like chemotaxis protein
MHSLNPIWLVEDSTKDIELALAALEDSNLANRVVVLRDGCEVLERLRDLEYQGRDCWPLAILLDIKMPKVSGLEVLRSIKADPRLKSLPVVMLTSSRQGSDIAECYALGANAYVVKPVGFAEFFEAVKALGVFWAVVNERPGGSKTGEAGHELLATGRV